MGEIRVDKSMAIHTTKRSKKHPDILKTFMDFIFHNPDVDFRTKIHIPHSSMFLVRSAIRAKTGVELHPYAVEKLLHEEGLMPAKNYGIPLWYRRKYLDPK